jgi:hypothetical protein
LRETVDSISALRSDRVKLRNSKNDGSLGTALHNETRAVIDRAYRLRSATVGALYERPLPFRSAKPLGFMRIWQRRWSIAAVLVVTSMTGPRLSIKRERRR